MSSRLRLGSLTIMLSALGSIGLPAPGLAVQMFDFVLRGAPQSTGSWLQGKNGSTQFYSAATVLSLELPDGLVDGPATLSNIVYPGPISQIGYFFDIVEGAGTPTSISGLFTRIGNEGHLDFDNVSLRFRRGTSAPGTEGTLTFNLSTGSQTIAAGCDGQAQRIVNGTPIDVAALQTTALSELSLIGTVCPYNDDSNPPGQHNNAFQWSLQGTVPEPGTGVLLGLGLSVLGASSRRRRA